VIASIAAVLALAGAEVLADEIRYTDSWAQQGISVARESASGLELSYSLARWNLGQKNIDGRSLHTIELPGAFLPNDAGAPDLPGQGWFIAIPNGASATVRVVASRYETLSGIELAPAPRLPLETEDGPPDYARNERLYATDASYPESPVTLSAIAMIRGVRVVKLGVSPFQYNPVRQELLVHRDLKIEISFSGGDGHFGDDRLRSRWFDPIFRANLLNVDSLAPADQRAVLAVPGSRTPDFEYLIICPDEPVFLAWADSLRVFRNEQGIRTGIRTISEVGGNTTAAIKNYLQDAYENWDLPPVAVLLLADYGTGSSGIISPVYDNYCKADNLFVDMNGDYLPDLIIARVAAENETHLATAVGKVLGYERQPPTNPGFYDNPVVTGGWQTERWFILCDEVLYGFMANVLGKSPVREYAIYSGYPGSLWSTAVNTDVIIDYFGPAGLGYVPATPTHLTDWGGNAARINADINAGAFFVQHRDHGFYDGWGEPDYDIPDLDGLNDNDLTFVFSVNCLTGAFDVEGECFAERFHRHTAGALGLIAATETSYSFVNDTYVWGMFDFMWPLFDPGHGETDAPGWGDPNDHRMLPAFANASGKYYLEASNWPYNVTEKQVTYNLFHHHGDAFTTVYSELPQNLVVVHDDVHLAGVDEIAVTADEGALIGIAVDGELLVAATATGAPQLVSIPPQQAGNNLTITVTRQNYFRYRSEIPVVPPADPYVIYSAHAINDADGNGNGQLDYTETALLSLTLQNVGQETARNVVAEISTDDDFLTIIDDSETYGDIAAESYATVADGFEIRLGAGVPDGHELAVALRADDDGATYESSFVITAHAPALEFNDYLVVDGDNNVLEPGETADLVISLINVGSSLVERLHFSLSSTDPAVAVNTNHVRVQAIQPDEVTIIVFNLTADPMIPVGEVVEFELTALADHYTYSTVFALPIGLSIEDFEGGHFHSFPWEMSGNAHWQLDSEGPYEGSYCVRSGDIEHNQSSELSVTAEVLHEGTISFYYRVSSESDYDHLRFFIDDYQMDSWSGTVSWSLGTYPVTAGNHTFKWSYDKDEDADGGQDCCWIDYIVFPAIGEPPRPSISVSPESIETTVEADEFQTRTLTLENSGEGELEYYISLLINERAAAERPPAAKLKKGVTDHREGQVPRRGSGGPDPFGYTWIDSDEPGGPSYNWIDISAVGTALVTADDANYGPFDLGFEMPFYGVPQDQVRICTNGWVSFSSTSTAFLNQPIPFTEVPNDLIAPYWDDLNPESGGTIYYFADVANQRFIVQWDDVHHFFNGDPETFQVIIHADGYIVYQYQTVALADGCTVGIENADGETGLPVVFNTSYLHDEMAVLITSEPLPEPWISINPSSGVVAPGSVGEISVLFDTTDTELGEYSSTISIHCNDPFLPVVDVPVTLHVVEPGTSVEQTLPAVHDLAVAQPNPFNALTTIDFSLPASGQVTLVVYDLAGHHVRTLVDDQTTAGHHTVTWNGRDDRGKPVASGTYYYRLSAGAFSATRPAVLIK